MNNTDSTDIVIALSGGVDSSVAALLLKNQGYRLKAVHMINWDSSVNELSESSECASNSEERKWAEKIAKILEIPLFIYNFTYEYWNDVFKPYLSQIENNLMGNPELDCNSKIKFGVLMRCVFRDFGPHVKLATGHYANVILDNGVYFLSSPQDRKRDQTYFLSQLNQTQLANIIFPLANIHSKEKVREIARANNLPNWNKKGSRGLCFVGKRRFRNFISSYLPSSERGGEIIDIENNEVLGCHDGLCYYSINQRRGLHISGKEEKYYICDKSEIDRKLYVCRGSIKERYLVKERTQVSSVHWISYIPREGEKLRLKFKHTGLFVSGKIEQICERMVTLHHEPYIVTTPGQYIVFYSFDKPFCLGSGIYLK